MESVPPSTKLSLGSKLLRKKRGTVDRQQLIKSFFGANSSIAVIVLVLIMVFLMREGAGFLSTYHHELGIYRKAGLEFCDLADNPLKEQQALAGALRRAVGIEMDPITKNARERRDTAFLLKQAIEDRTKSVRTDLEAALEDSPEAPDALARLRASLAKKTAAAAAAADYGTLYTA